MGIEALVPPVQERRKCPRFVPLIPLHVSPRDGKTWTSRITSLSEKGIAFTAPFDPPVGSYIAVQVAFSDSAPLSLDLRLAWKKIDIKSKEGLVGMGFAVMDRKDAPVFRAQMANVPQLNAPTRRGDQARRRGGDGASTDKRGFDRRGMVNILSRTYAKNVGLDRWGSYYAYERIIKASQGTAVHTNREAVLMFGSNNYLGLTHHPKVIEATNAAVARYGTGAGGARVLSGTTELHRRLEERVASFKGTEAALVFSTGYLANVAVLTSLVEKNDIVLNDQYNHASIIDGCRLTEGTVRFYRHGDMVALEKKLKQYPTDRPKLIITDGVFSMDGDIAPLDRIVALAKKHNATVMVDDAHAVGVIGEKGKGTSAHFGLTGEVDITITTFSKTLGTMGGAICGPKSLIKYITHHSRQFIFSTAIVPAACATALAALDVMETEPQWVERLHVNQRKLVEGLRTLGFRVVEGQTAIVPVFIGDERKTYAFTHLLDEMGVFVNAVSRPSVPRELSRIRLTPMATHTDADISRALDALGKAGKKLGII